MNVNGSLSAEHYMTVPSGNNDIDLLKLIRFLWRKKIKILLLVCVFAVSGLTGALIYPHNWTSMAVITPADPIQLTELEKMWTRLRVLDVDVKANREELFNLFIKKFRSASLVEEYLRSSAYVKAYIKAKEADEGFLHRTVVALSEQMRAVNDSAQQKKNDTTPYTSWTLSFTASTGQDAQTLLAGYIDYVSEAVVNKVIQYARDQLMIKTQFETQKLAQDRVKIRNQLDAKIQRLGYSLEIASAAGIVKPLYSNGQAVRDDPDFPISLGVDGIRRKLEIEKELTDIAEINDDLLNRQYMVEELAKTIVDNVRFEPFSYQASPSLPVKHDGPGTIVTVILSALTGFMVACCGGLLQHALNSGNRSLWQKDMSGSVRLQRHEKV
ncbi:ferric enterobactin transport protein FepE [Escherichia coli]|nr:ferric enterobactin transport protein FepE [Escherichia coli]CAD6109902.1 ferric enterobactin transport protein FepE [Escherichia coli]CAD6554590.1 ferric enterobactin transport protein FepE [Escherichia coli]